MSNPSGLRKDKNPTVSALLGVAAIQILVGFLGWSVYRDSFGWFDWIIMFSGAIYIALSVAARWIRLSAALIGAALYAAFLALQAFRGIDWLMSGLIFKVPVVLLLLVAVVSALQRSHPPGHPRCTP